MHSHPISRRTFLGASGALLLGRAAIGGQTENATVVAVKTPRLLSGNSPDLKGIQAALSLGIRRLTRQEDASAAWRSLFTPADVVGIKLNHIGAEQMPGNAEIARALAEALLAAGVPERQIIVIEGGETIGGVRADSEPDPETFRVRETRLWFKKYMTKQISALINVPLLKHHSIAGVSLGLKNLSHGTIWNPSHFHQDHCDPAIAEIVALPPIRGKLRLTICNALFGLAEKGPYVTDAKWLWRESSLLMSTDAVALDAVGLEIIGRQRGILGLPPFEATDARPTHIATAGRMGLGVADPARVRIEAICNVP